MKINKVSVLMSALLDSEEKRYWFSLAVTSIWLQKCNIPVEFVIVDDGGVEEELNRYQYMHIYKTTVKLREHKGLAYALNAGIKYCTGDLIVRMDADDIALPGLLQAQVDWFNSHPESNVCGVQIACHKWDNWETLSMGCFPTNHPETVTRKLAWEKLGTWFVNHPGVAYRTDFIKKFMYREGSLDGKEIRGMEDFCLWLDILKAGYTIHNQPEVYVQYRWKPTPSRETLEHRKALKKEKSILRP